MMKIFNLAPSAPDWLAPREKWQQALTFSLLIEAANLVGRMAPGTGCFSQEVND